MCRPSIFNSFFLWGKPVLQCRAIQFCVKACAGLQSLISVCFYFILFVFHFAYFFHWFSFVHVFVWSSLVYLFWSSTTLMYNFKMICSLLSWSLSALFYQFYSALCTLLSLSDLFLLLSQFLPSIFWLFNFLVFFSQYRWLFLGPTS